MYIRCGPFFGRPPQEPSSLPPALSPCKSLPEKYESTWLSSASVSANFSESIPTSGQLSYPEKTVSTVSTGTGAATTDSVCATTSTVSTSGASVDSVNISEKWGTDFPGRSAISNISTTLVTQHGADLQRNLHDLNVKSKRLKKLQSRSSHANNVVIDCSHELPPSAECQLSLCRPADTTECSLQSQNPASPQDSLLPVNSSPPSSVSANATVDTLPASDQPLDQASVTVEESIVVSTSSADTLQSSTLISSVSASSAVHARLLAIDKTIQCPNCNYFSLRPCNIRRHCIRHHNLVSQGIGLPLREPLGSEMEYVKEIRKRLATDQQFVDTPDAESQSQNQLPEDSVLPVTLSPPSSVLANANVDTLPASNQPLEQASVTIEGSIVVSTSSASTVLKTVECPNCHYSCLPRNMQRHCVNCHNMVWQGIGLPLREALESEMGLVKRMRKRSATDQQFVDTPDTESQSQSSSSSRRHHHRRHHRSKLDKAR